MLQGYLKTSSGRFQEPSPGRLQDIFKLLISNLFKMYSKRFCTWMLYKICVNILGMTWNILLELGLTLKTSRRSLQNVFISRDSFQRTWSNPQDVQRKSSKRFCFCGLFSDVLRTRSCAHWVFKYKGYKSCYDMSHNLCIYKL